MFPKIPNYLYVLFMVYSSNLNHVAQTTDLQYNII